MTPLQIIFLQVATVEEKLNAICKTVQQHFKSRENLLITVHDAASATFIDQLLWKTPVESFLPHLISTQPTKEPVVITTVPRNLNQAQILINLCPDCSPILTQFQRVYELWDLTHPAKTAAAEQRYKTYQEAGFDVVR
jgi:DNA polymerase-3 subunit chi